MGAFCLGVAKTGIPGLALINIVIMAEFFEKESVGIVLPVLILCDLIIYPLYRKFSSWKAILPLLTTSILGILLGYFVLRDWDGKTTKTAIGWIILAMLGIQLLKVRFGQRLASMPDTRLFRWSSGLLIGISTTLANAAGPVYAVWALVSDKSKEDFLGIGARLFLLLNLIKVPFNADMGIIHARTLYLDLLLAPAAIAGIVLGRYIVLRIPQKAFDHILSLCCLAGALWLILKS
ncbi:MAG: sulfite exporter TauE/SafE family protein [Verrucomicrobiota bacterium]